MHTPRQSAVSPRAALPSWLLSLGFHLALLLLTAVLIRTPGSAVSSEKDRSVGIALAYIDSSLVEYFDDTDRPAQDAAMSRVESQEAAAAAELPDRQALSRFEGPEIDLPAAATALPAGDSLIAEPELSGGGKVRLLPNEGVAEILAEEAARRKYQKALGPPAHLSLFGSGSTEGHSFFFVIDRSNSMGSGGLGVLARATREFDRSLAALQPSHRFQILAYNHNRVLFGNDDLVAATDANKQLVRKFMQGLAAFGATNHFMAITSALNRNPDVIFLLTDGGDPPLSESQLTQIRKRAAGRTTIHCIQFGGRPSDGEENFMHRLARQNGGTYCYIDVSRLPPLVGAPSPDA